MASEAHEGFSQPLSSGKADLRGWGSILKTPLTLPTTHLQRLITLYKQLSASSYPKNSFLFCWSTSYSHKTGFCYFYISYAIHISCKTHINCATLYELYMLFAVKMGERWTRNWVTRVSMHLPIALLWLLLVRCLKELSFSRKSVVSLQGRELELSSEEERLQGKITQAGLAPVTDLIRVQSGSREKVLSVA